MELLQLSQVVLHELLERLLYYQWFLRIQHNHLGNLQGHFIYSGLMCNRKMIRHALYDLMLFP